ncbi:hypothetical protein [Paenibacillus phage SV21]|nr:hypothetical protein [Paenibacillus phage SV21]
MTKKELIKSILVMTSLTECPEFKIPLADIFPESVEKIGDIIVELMHMSEKDIERDIADLFKETCNELIEEYDRRLKLKEKEA